VISLYFRGQIVRLLVKTIADLLSQVVLSCFMFQLSFVPCLDTSKRTNIVSQTLYWWSTSLLTRRTAVRLNGQLKKT